MRALACVEVQGCSTVMVILSYKDAPQLAYDFSTIV
jgi:hypothetical protein